jgi:hypothetical protein
MQLDVVTALRARRGGERTACLMLSLLTSDVSKGPSAGALLRVVVSREDAGEHRVHRPAGKAVVEWCVSVKQAVIEGA